MSKTFQRHDHGRAAKATALIAALSDLPLSTAARSLVGELEVLFSPRPPDPEIREMLELIPGNTFAEKGKRIGISKRGMWEIWHGRYRPNAEVMARIEQVLAEEESVNA